MKHIENFTEINMSELIFNEVDAEKNYYKFDGWKLYTVHDDANIKGFFGDYRWLSNFHECSVFFEGLRYRSSENAYQAAKIYADSRHHLQDCYPKESKKKWKKYTLLDDSKEEWDARKYDVMSSILFDKFYRHVELRQKLIETGDKYLEETNHWTDCDWGVDVKFGGKNNLGKILTKIRSYWRE